MPIQKIKSGRIITTEVNDYVGDKGVIFYDEDVAELRLSDGITPGGILFATGGGGVGVRGYTGSRGFTGSQGTTGFTGSQGNLGYTGSQGTIGFTGYTGSAGINGYTGSSGSLGYTGSAGINGTTGYTGSAGINGYTGSQGIAGSKGDTGTLEVSLITLGNTIINTVTNVTALRFDSDSGFDVIDLGGGTAKVQLNSTFKFWDVDGSPGLVAEGLDTVNFIASTGTKILAFTSGSNKSLTFSINPATTSTLGGIKVGANLTIDPDGTLNANTVTSGISDSFKTIKVNSQTDLIAVGEDTIEFKAGPGVIIETSATSSPYKSITISSSALVNVDGGMFDTVFDTTTLMFDGGSP